MQKGLLIVIEGVDGSGKTTQVNLISETLKQKNIPHEVISFPRYADNIYGKLIRRYLEGEFGGTEEVNPYLMACIFAGDRHLAKPLIENFLNEGKVVLANRYVASSKAHMSANLTENKREEFMAWLDELEYQTNKIPKEDLNILLNVDPEIAQKNIRGEKGPVDRSSNKDIHETSLNHLKTAQGIYLEISKAEQNWKVVECMEGGRMKDKEVIHKLVVEILDSFLVS